VAAAFAREGGEGLCSSLGAGAAAAVAVLARLSRPRVHEMAVDVNRNVQEGAGNLPGGLPTALSGPLLQLALRALCFCCCQPDDVVVVVVNGKRVC